MNTPFDPTDPLLQILAEDAADLPVKAAGEARQTRALQVMRRRQIAITATVLLGSVCVWQFVSEGKVGQESVAIQTTVEAPIAFPEPAFPEPAVTTCAARSRTIRATVPTAP